MYASSLYLNMGYYHIEISPGYKHIYTIVLPWGKYKYQKIPMGVYNSYYIFQWKYPKYLKVSTWYARTLMT